MSSQNEKRTLTLREKHLKRVKKHKKTAVRDSVITLGICVLIVTFYSVFSQGVTPGTASAGEDEQTDDGSLLSISATGDIMLGRSISKITDRKGMDYLFEEASPLLQETDITAGNLAHPVLNEESDHPDNRDEDKSYWLHTDEEGAEAILDAGFTHLNLANSQIGDYGAAGIHSTMDVLSEAGTAHFGTGYLTEEKSERWKPHYEEVNGMTVASIGFRDHEAEATNLVYSPDPAEVVRMVHEASGNADFVIVHAEWGEEYDSSVHPRQRSLAEAIAEAGADLIIGHGSHVLQPVEEIDGTVVAYGLGNFIFDQGWSMNRETAVLQYRLFEDSIEVEVHPFYIKEGQPRPVTGTYRKERVFSRMTDDLIFTSRFNDEWEHEDDRLVKTIER
ncbi:CapA family protein [Alteribacter natronophilus]|uniref:CapA family protein n=1 Tax=Alteribacter natronophilus TaxID=2583810 RepID=UPI00110E1F32|nr:CapA family protein [Alteribacter natronophilus]TMW72231.1 CapA family protein [Alteribacter natronophilus]